jgi:hypothetical protein
MGFYCIYPAKHITICQKRILALVYHTLLHHFVNTRIQSLLL